jgi:uncharacterized protein (TIGR02145 family)
MKKQCKKLSSWRCKGLLSVALSSLAVIAFAQGVEVCTGTTYTIASTVNASGASTYQWLENGQIIPGASAASYTVPNNKATGLYAYIRQAKSADCPDWQPSNEFVVTVFDCSFTAGTATGAAATFTDPRDGKKYKTVVMPDGKTWLAQNLNYTKDLTYNPYAYESNGKQYNEASNGVPAIGSYWCPAADRSVVSGDEEACRVYGALYTWETAMMVDGKYSDETKTSSAWNESWVSPYYYSGVPSLLPKADRNNARGGTNVKGGGRGICPMGWHVPTTLEWATMLDKVEKDGNGVIFANAPIDTWIGTDVGKKLKSASTYTADNFVPGAWLSSPAHNGTDQLAFSARPSGVIDANNRVFSSQGSTTVYWSACPQTWLSAYTFNLTRAHTGASFQLHRRYHAYSLRCISDN